MSFLSEWHKQQKALKDAERDSKKNASSIMHSYRGGEHALKDIEQTKALKDAERVQKKDASTLLHSYRGCEHDTKGNGRIVTEERKEKHGNENVDHKGPDVLAELKRGARDLHIGTSRQLLTVDFSFGLIYENSEQEPDIDSCAQAASVIVPHAISQWSSETKIFCDVKAPEVMREISTDDWYDSEDSTRYVVKGKVPVYLFVETSEKESITSLQKVLKRHVSFKPISVDEMGEVTKDKRSQFIIGEDGAQQWMRVREGRLGGLGITF